MKPDEVCVCGVMSCVVRCDESDGSLCVVGKCVR